MFTDLWTLLLLQDLTWSRHCYSSVVFQKCKFPTSNVILLRTTGLHEYTLTHKWMVNLKIWLYPTWWEIKSCKHRTRHIIRDGLERSFKWQCFVNEQSRANTCYCNKSLGFCKGYILRSLQISKLTNTTRRPTLTHRFGEDTASVCVSESWQ